MLDGAISWPGRSEFVKNGLTVNRQADCELYSSEVQQPEHSRSGQDLGLLAFELLGGDDASVAQVSELG